MKEAVFYAFGALMSLFILGYAVHMIIGGLVTQHTEIIAIIAVVVIGTVAITLMARDVLKRRR